MASSGPVKVGIVGSRFQADCIAGAVKAVPDVAALVAVASPTKGNAAAFAKRHGVPHAYSDYRELLKNPEVELISITAPIACTRRSRSTRRRPANTSCARNRCVSRSKKPTP